MNENDIRDFFIRLRAMLLREDEPSEAEQKALAVQGLAIVEVVIIKLVTAK